MQTGRDDRNASESILNDYSEESTSFKMIDFNFLPSLMISLNNPKGLAETLRKKKTDYDDYDIFN